MVLPGIIVLINHRSGNFESRYFIKISGQMNKYLAVSTFVGHITLSTDCCVFVGAFVFENIKLLTS
jgi:hypothetical protein